MSSHTTSDEAMSLYTRGERFHRFKEFAAAEEALRAALKVDESFPPAWDLLGTVYQAMGQAEKARASFVEASARNPSWTLPVEHLGLLEYSLKAHKDSVKALKKYMKLGGCDQGVLLTLARAAFEASDCTTVLSVTSKILANDEELYEVWEMRGLCQAMTGRFNAASVSLNMAISLNPDSIEALNKVGDLCYDVANYMRAVEFYGPSLAKKPIQPGIIFRHGTALWFTGQWSDAIPFLENYTELVPADPKGWNNLGVVMREKGLVKRALECFTKAQRIDPSLEAPKKNMDTATDKQALP